MALWLLILGIAAGAVAVMPAPETVIGQFQTSLVGRTPNQRHNARLAAWSLNGKRVGPGAEFSFNQTVGSWSWDAGYRKAPVSFNGQLVPAWGGGVCQTSTTLYNAALLAGLEVLERHPHRFAPTYCPPGRDAAVAYSNIDLRLRNPHPFPVRVEATVRGDSLTVRLIGARELAQSPRIVTEVLTMSAPDRRTTEEANSGRVRNGGKPGFDVATYRVVGDRRERLSIDSYPPMPRVVEYR